MTFCAEYCIEMPCGFPVIELTEFMAEARRVLVPAGSASPQWSEFGGASNLIGWRYKSSSDAWLEFRTAVEAHGGERDHEDVYQRERSLFIMFSSGVSCIESTTYAIAAAASHPQVCGIAFAEDQQRACNPARLRGWLAPHAKAAQLVAALNNLLAAHEWKLWVDLRNRMTHRSNLPRRIFASTGSSPPRVNPLNYASTSSTPDIDADLADWDALHTWLGEELRTLLVSGTAMLRAA